MDAIFWFVPAVALVVVLFVCGVLCFIEWREQKWFAEQEKWYNEKIIVITGGKPNEWR